MRAKHIIMIQLRLGFYCFCKRVNSKVPHAGQVKHFGVWPYLGSMAFLCLRGVLIFLSLGEGDSSSVPSRSFILSAQPGVPVLFAPSQVGFFAFRSGTIPRSNLGWIALVVLDLSQSVPVIVILLPHGSSSFSCTPGFLKQILSPVSSSLHLETIPIELAGTCFLSFPLTQKSTYQGRHQGPTPALRNSSNCIALNCRSLLSYFKFT